MAGVQKNMPGCTCCAAPCTPATRTATIQGCNSGTLTGATVTATGPGTTVSGTTNSSGQVTLSLDAAGTWTFSASKSGFTSGSTFVFGVTCGSSGSLSPLALTVASGFECYCFGMTCGDVIPDTLTCVHSLGTVTLTFDGSSSSWKGCASYTVTGRSGGCNVATSGSIPMRFVLQCLSGPTYQLGVCYPGCTDSGVPAPNVFADFRAGSGPFSCASAFGCPDAATNASPACSPFSASFSFTGNPYITSATVTP